MNNRHFYTSMLTLWLCHFLVDFMIGIWSVYKTIADLDLAICGLIAGSCAFLGEGMQAVFGSFSDRGHRFVLIIFGMTLTISNAFMAYTDNYLILFALFLMTCIGSGAFHPSAVSLITDLTKKRKGLLTALYVTGGGLGMAISQIVFTYTFYEMEGGTAILAIPTLLVIALLFANSNSLPIQTPSTTTRKIDFKGFISYFRHPQLSKLYIIQLCGQSIFWGTMFLLPDILQERGYNSWITFGGGHMVFVLGSIFFMIPGGYIADLYSPKNVIVVSTTVSIAIFYCFLMFPFLSPALLLLLLFLFGAAIGVSNPVVIALGHRIMPNNTGRVSAFLMGLVWCVSEGLGQFGGGLLSKLFVDDAAAKALGCLGILLMVGLWAATRLPKEVPVPEKQIA